MHLPIPQLTAKNRLAIAPKKKEEAIDLVIPNNWVDFARLTKIRSGGNVIAFDPYDYQRSLVELMQQRSVCVVKSRQLGISETITCFMLWRACLNPGYLGLVFSKTQADSSLIARRMKRMILSLGLKTATENLSDIEILGRGRILFRSSKPESGRGIESVVDVFYDEWAFVDTAKEVHDAVAPSQQMVGSSAREFIVSTPNGKSGFYWDLLSSGNGDRDVENICNHLSKSDTNSFQYWVDSGGWGKVLIHWRSHPIYGNNPNFLQEVHEKQKLSWTTIRQEYDLSFEESETNVFLADIIRANAIGSWELERDESATYYLGIDTSTTGEDYSVAIVLKKYNNYYSVVNIYRKRQQSSQYHLYQIGELIKKYKPTKVAIEVTGGTGQIYLETLSKEFTGIAFESIRTTGDSKPAMVSSLQLALEKQILRFPPDSVLVEELLSFKREGKKLSAPNGKHDDALMSLCFGLAIAEQAETYWSLDNAIRL